MPTANDRNPHIVEQIVAAVSPLLRGFSPEIQGAALADLTALWLAGHVGSQAAQFREEELGRFVGLVRQLIPANEKLVLERLKPDGEA